MTGKEFLLSVITQLAPEHLDGRPALLPGIDAAMRIGEEMDHRGLPEIGRELYVPRAVLKIFNQEMSTTASEWDGYNISAGVGEKVGMIDRFVIYIAPDDFPMFGRMRDDGGLRVGDYEKDGLLTVTA